MAVGGGAGGSRSAACCAALLAAVLLFSAPITTEAYDSLDPNGNITIKWDLMQWTPDGYVAVVTMYNYQQFRHIQAPGWQLGWTWAKKEVIWSMVGAQTTEQGDCSKFKGNTPHCCKRDPTIVDLLPGTPYNMQIANCLEVGADAGSEFSVHPLQRSIPGLLRILHRKPCFGLCPANFMAVVLLLL